MGWHVVCSVGWVGLCVTGGVRLLPFSLLPKVEPWQSHHTQTPLVVHAIEHLSISWCWLPWAIHVDDVAPVRFHCSIWTPPAVKGVQIRYPPQCQVLLDDDYSTIRHNHQLKFKGPMERIHSREGYVTSLIHIPGLSFPFLSFFFLS